MRVSTDRFGPIDPVALLQVVGIAWVVVNQFREPIAALVGARIGLIDKGYLGAALFFFAEGRLLLERYESRAANGSSASYLAWIGERLAWLYPLHVLILAALVIAVAAPFGLPPQHSSSFGVRDVFAHLTLTQAWGLAHADSWNFPSWLVSADWGLVLALPLAAPLLHRRPAFIAALGVAVFFAGSAIADAHGRLFADLTTLGLLQAIPAGLIGAALCEPSGARARSPILSAFGFAAILAWVGLAANLKLPDIVIWPALGGLVVFVGAWRRTLPARPNGRSTDWGGAAIALQLTYLPVEMVVRRLAMSFRGPSELSAGELALMAVAIMSAAAAAFWAVQRPAYRWLTRSAGLAPEPSTPPKP